MVDVSSCCKTVAETVDDVVYPVDMVLKDTSATRNSFMLFNIGVRLFERLASSAHRSVRALARELGRSGESLAVLKVVYDLKDLVSGEAMEDNPFGKGINIPRLLSGIFSLGENVCFTVDWLSSRGVIPKSVASANFGSIATFKIGFRQVEGVLGVLSGSFGLVDNIGHIHNEGKQLTVNTLLKTVMNTTVVVASVLFLVATPICITLGLVVASIGITTALGKFVMERYNMKVSKVKGQDGRLHHVYRSKPVIIAQEAKKVSKQIEACGAWIRGKLNFSEKAKAKIA